MQNKLLGIAIPTYNRPKILEENILAMLPEIRRLGVPIYISDDSPGDETEVMVAKLRQLHKPVYYTRNKPSLGHDMNFVATIKSADTDYVWYLGDSVVIDQGGLEKVHALLLTSRPDFCFVNNEIRCVDTRDYHVNDLRDFLKRFAWHLTLSGATIYSRAAVHSLTIPSVESWRNFPQLGLIFQYGLVKNRTAYWLGSCGVSSNRNKKSYWSSAVVTTFAVDWVNLVKNFSSAYSDTELREIFLSHSLHTGIFGWRKAIRYRLDRALTFKLLRTYRLEIKLAAHTNYAFLTIISLLPVAASRRIVKFLKGAKSRLG